MICCDTCHRYSDDNGDDHCSLNATLQTRSMRCTCVCVDRTLVAHAQGLSQGVPRASAGARACRQVELPRLCQGPQRARWARRQGGELQLKQHLDAQDAQRAGQRWPNARRSSHGRQAQGRSTGDGASQATTHGQLLCLHHHHYQHSHNAAAELQAHCGTETSQRAQQREQDLC